MPFTAEQVDEVIAKFEKCAQRQSANKASEVKLRAAERDLLQAAEGVRDMLVQALKWDRAFLLEIFGGGCKRFHCLRQIIDSVELSEMHANDQRWKHLSDAMVTIEEVLKQLGMFRPFSRKTLSLEIVNYKGHRERFLPGARVSMKPVVVGNLTGYSVEPDLPASLELNASSGDITGILKQGIEIAETLYNITAQGVDIEDAIATYELRFAVAFPAPKSLAYAVPSECYTGEVVIWPADVQGGAPSSWTVAPELPAGLFLDKRTGAIAGTPSAVSEPIEYTVTASNTSGQAVVTLNMGICLAPPLSVSYPGSVPEFSIGGVVYLTPEVAMKTSETNRKAPSAKWQNVRKKLLPRQTAPGGLVRMPSMRFSVEPALPSGLVLAPKTGRLLGTPTEPAEETTYNIVCKTNGGEVSTSLTFGVKLKPPSGLEFPTACPVLFTGQAVTLQPTVDGLTQQWSVEPELPKGLHLDPVLGTISGMPTEVVPEKTFVVTAKNSEGSCEAELKFAVQRAAPSGLAYPALEPEFPVHQSIALQPTVVGEVEQFSVEPELPKGLSLHPGTGVISGTAEESSESKSYTVTARNESGAATSTLTFGLTVMPPQSLTYPQVDDMYAVGENVKLDPKVVGGATSWTVEPHLPKGMELDESTGRISGAPVNVVDEKSYVVTAMNESGGTSVVLTFAVTAPKPEGLSYPAVREEYIVDDQVLLEPELSSGVDGVTFSVKPNLPRSLKLDPETGVISGVVAAAVDQKTYTITATNPGGSTTAELTFACTTQVDAITGVNQHFAMMVEEVTDIAEMVQEPAKNINIGNWMVWMVHRAWLNDPALTMLDFTGKHMPPPHNEPRIAPKLMKAMAHNTHLLSLQLSNSCMMTPQGHQLAASLRKNNTLQVINIENNNLDAASLKEILDALRESSNSSLAQLKFNCQKTLGESFGRQVEESAADLMEKNQSIVKLGFCCSDAHWRLTIDRALLRNNDLARRRRKGSISTAMEDDTPAQEKPLSGLLLSTAPDSAVWEVFDEEDERVLLVRGYVANSRRLPTKDQLQSYAKGRGKSLPYSAVAPLTKAFGTKLLNAMLYGQVTCTDAYGAAFEGTLRNWSEKNERWSLDVWQSDGTRFNFVADKQPTIETSQELATWLQVVDTPTSVARKPSDK